MAKKEEKTAAARSSDAKAPAGQEAAATNSSWLYIVGAVAAVALIAGAFYWRASSAGGTNEDGDPDLAELMAPGPLPDLSLGKEDAPNTIVEYASMTCPHCAHFHKAVLPELQKKYIDTGQVRLILREGAALLGAAGILAEAASGPTAPAGAGRRSASRRRPRR